MMTVLQMMMKMGQIVRHMPTFKKKIILILITFIR